MEAQSGVVETEKLDIVAEARKNADDAWLIDKHNRDAAIDDLRFAVGEQWDDKSRQARKGRPCLTFNELGKFRRQVTGEARQNKPQIEVKPVDSDGDPAVADIFEGLIREIEHRSKAITAYNTALDASSGSGFSYLVVERDYSDDRSFDQELKIRRVTNQFGIYHDLTCKNFDGSDMSWALECDTVIPVEEFHRRYGKDKVASEADLLPQGSQTQIQWFPEGAVRLGCYYKRHPHKRTLAEVEMLDMTTQTLEADLKPGDPYPGPTGEPIGRVRRVRRVDSWKVKKYVISGAEVLDEEEWPGTSIPVVPMYGEETFIEGKRYVNGIIRFAKDPQRFKNYFLTSIAERLMTSHRNPYMGTEEMFEGHERDWESAHVEPKAYLKFNADPRVAGGRPVKDNPTEFNVAEAQMLSVASQGLYDTTGIYPPSLGQRSNEVSGRAILARQKEADSGTFVYIDNRDIAIQRVGEILVEVIPKVYDSSRIMRVRGKDNRVAFVPVNAPIQGMPTPGGMLPVDAVTQMPIQDFKMPTGAGFNENGFLVDMKTQKPVFMNDLSAGRFDVVVSVGSSHGTKRQEAVNLLLEFSRAYPPSVPFVGDLVAKNLDIIEGEELAKRFQMLMQMAQAQQMGGAPGAAPNKAQDEFGNQQAKGMTM